jgi:pimeloyl-ACP methyl ester carboxylesterase
MNRRLAAVLVVTALVLAACVPDKQQIGPSDVPTPQVSAPTGEPGTAVEPQESRVYDQEVNWERCGAGECATIQVPLDWSDANGPTIGIAVKRLAATDADARLGSVLINPGGPGGSGLEFADYFSESAGEELLRHYDVVGFDPRGVGQSTPVACGDGPTLDAFYVTDFAYETQADVDAAVARNAEFAQGCEQDSGPIAQNVDTVSAARDMDVIRALVGDEQLNYMGFSYGTQLGATYAELYPANVGRLVLDGAVDFLLPSQELSAGQAAGFETSLGNFLDWCVPQEDCAIGDTKEQARQAIYEMTQTALETGYPTDTPWDLNGNLMVYGIVVTLYDEASWPYLQLALNEVVEDGSARIMYELANFYLDRDGGTGEYIANSTLAFTAINCLDEGASDDWTIDDVQEFTEIMELESPTFGWWFGTGVGCQGWPWSGDDIVTSLDNASTAAPMLVVGTTKDPATPYRWSQSLAERLGTATLLTYDGEGHTAYGRSNRCIIDAVDTFMVEGTMPAEGTVC